MTAIQMSSALRWTLFCPPLQTHACYASHEVSDRSFATDKRAEALLRPTTDRSFEPLQGLWLCGLRFIPLPLSSHVVQAFPQREGGSGLAVVAWVCDRTSLRNRYRKCTSWYVHTSVFPFLECSARTKALFGDTCLQLPLDMPPGFVYPG